jgi:hypothetical protein
VSSTTVSSTARASNTTAPTQFVTVGDNKYAYRQFGSGFGLPLLFLQHFTGTLDGWDPAVTDPLAIGRSIILPNVKGRTDHFWVRSAHNGLFVSAPGNNTEEIIGIGAQTVGHTISVVPTPKQLRN